MANKQKHRIYSPQQIADMTLKARRRGFAHALLMMLAYLMEEPEFGFDEDKLCALFQAVERWELNRTEQHDISIKKVQQIIERVLHVTIRYEP